MCVCVRVCVRVNRLHKRILVGGGEKKKNSSRHELLLSTAFALAEESINSSALLFEYPKPLSTKFKGDKHALLS